MMYNYFEIDSLKSTLFLEVSDTMKKKLRCTGSVVVPAIFLILAAMMGAVCYLAFFR